MASTTPRTTLLAVSALCVSILLGGCGRPTPAKSASRSTTASAAASDSVHRTLARIEQRYHARLGLFVMDTGSGHTVSYRPDERFAYCSTSKALTAGLVLQRATDAQLSRTIHYGASNLVDYSPVTSKHTRDGMSLSDVIAAALDYSDNTAANLLFEQLGGASEGQARLRATGDTTTHMDRTEPTLNNAVPGDVRDTSTPRALAEDLRRFVLGGLLTGARKAKFTRLLQANTTGAPYIRAGVPSGWKVGDKTGNGGYGTRNDIAVLWPPHRAPLVVAVLTDRGTKNAKSDDALIADATRAALAAFG